MEIKLRINNYISQTSQSFRATASHLSLMISFMEEHADLARGSLMGRTGKRMHRDLWHQLANELNALDLGQKSVKKWQKTWTDFKYMLKKKYEHQQRVNQIRYTPLEMKMLSVLGIQMSKNEDEIDDFAWIDSGSL